MEENNSSLLFSAVCNNDAAAVQEALRNGADVKCIRPHVHKYSRARTHITPLREACERGNDEIVRILLDAGADTWAVDCSVLDYAIRKGHISIVELLLNHDKNILEMADKQGQTPLFVAMNYYQFDIVCLLLDRGANVHAATKRGTTTLMISCDDLGNMAIMRLLLTAGVDVNARDEIQQTALHKAAIWQLFEAANELILQHNANMFAVDKNGKTPFDSIIHRSRSGKPFLEHFLAIYSNKMAHDHGRLALHVILKAAGYAFVENTKFHPPLKPLLQIRLPLGTLTLNEFRYLLRHLFRTLLRRLHTEIIRNRDENGKLPVHIACQNNAPVEVLSILVEMDAATLHIADHTGGLPLHECCCDGVVDDSSVRFLVEQGGVGTLAARTREGALPLHVLCGSTNPSLRTVQYLIHSFPGSVAARTNAGLYPFVIAASKAASLSVVYELVRVNPDLVSPN